MSELSVKIAKVAVSKATYWIDKPYDYIIPENLEKNIVSGVRVRVRFSKSNRICDGIVLSVTESEKSANLKTIEEVIDVEPVISQDFIKLALYMREQFFCTVFEAVRSMLPLGLWLNSAGKRKVNDAYIEIAGLSVTKEEAENFCCHKSRKAPMQSSILEVLSDFNILPVKDLLKYSGASRETLNSLCKSGYISIDKREVYRRPVNKTYENTTLPELNEEQNKAFEQLKSKLFSGSYSISLLNGVTGSGKTMVYAHLIKLCLNYGFGAIFLLPEISLTPQMVALFSSFFGDKVALLHSGLTNGERYDEWKRIKANNASVVIGTRSAIFAPVNNLGLIIIDEEHEETYQSEAAPRYNAKDVARFRCNQVGCPLVIGSATPDISSTFNALNGKYDYIRLKHRFNESAMPVAQIVDMKAELISGNGNNISNTLKNELAANINRGEQSIVFINRRGTNKLISCNSCGYVYMCPNCSVALTYHGDGNRLICHCCGYSEHVEKRCPNCGGMLSFQSVGTQGVVDELKNIFPDIDILRMDSDSVSMYGSHDALFEKFINDKIPILVGTQMVGKGLNFENVTLVGVISADLSLYAGDYRASERTFSMLAQVIGRSGRGTLPGRAVIQTFTPDNPVIKLASEQNYDEFYSYELGFRKLQHMPPFGHYYRITLTHSDENKCVECADYIAACLNSVSSDYDDMYVFGPAPLSIAKINNKYRFSVSLSCVSEKIGRAVISNTLIKCKKNKLFHDVTAFAEYNPL